MNYEKQARRKLRTSSFKYLRHLMISHPSPVWLLGLSGFYQVSELQDGLMLAPGLTQLLSHRRQMFGKCSGNCGEPGRRLVTSKCSGWWLVCRSPTLISKRDPDHEKHSEIILTL